MWLYNIAEVQITIGGQDQEAKISSYEDALAKIKDTTGVSDIQVCTNLWSVFRETDCI